MHDGRFRLGPVLGIALLLLPFAYVGSYLALMQQEISASPFGVEAYPNYRFGGQFSKNFFSPAHWVDCKLRPDYWGLEADSPEP